MNLKEILIDIEFDKIFGDKFVKVDGICYDSRKVEKNYLFVCIEGFKTDGHKYIKNAIDKGASAVVIEKITEDIEKYIEENNVVFVKVNNSRKALSKIASNFYKNPSKKLKVIGVTGTNGKTSITHLINTILRENNYKCGLIGTIQNEISGKVYKTSRTTPEAVELHNLFNEMVQNKVDVCTMEVSSHSLDLHRVDDVNFNIGIFTNLTEDHLDYHKDMRSYKNAKIKLFYKTSDVNIINIDDKYGKEIYDEIKKINTKILTYGLNSRCDIYAKDIDMKDSFSSFTLITPKYSGRIRINIPGLFSIYNILASISACYSLGLNYEQILKGVNSIKPVRGRFELVENDRGIKVIVDYAHTPDALRNVLSTIKGFVRGKIITVFGCGGERDSAKRPVMGKIATELSDYVIITNDNPRGEKEDKIINDILKGIDFNEKYTVIKDRYEAIKKALEFANKDDVVLIAGKGHETYQIIGDRVYDFNDKAVAEEILRR
ncbi:UDP-N-acetylmuramoylalanyl-D-glutamate--2,6-diaminopimelate ligase [Caminicella sporogenes DSM 14501]|uniref:UDP-N-acetylmuramoyl-L-alanyl-D-glutamate--2,6-diaminopimelate ligase n=1 Tax=Caminicella sporogenes DSM 14501 TaxID=1121266 RepID=A0A1M6L144_9FIRM|nr:UDP-N-acetylmuramoyl-L-alanyl-D-glutamate--2,6-diaminopimelate ligase [Caminicella sporogenes]RKD27667.1 UDP-N-acetylmuramoyl-L-alanyl-D-glutamate--2,6-diaminopimelate ligase [Caminicella sporogenes]SHJ64856.1 UDP-N-acetylmuramoylalanyl-D-glutamate--2,6-diaminopimelate ligase [Caminicella sporogenes DSM 14501]